MDLFKTIFRSGMPLDQKLANNLLRLPHVVFFNSQESTEHLKMKAAKFTEGVLDLMKQRKLEPNVDTHQMFR